MANGSLSFVSRHLADVAGVTQTGPAAPDPSARLVEELLARLQAPGPQPPQRPGTARRIIGALGDALLAAGAARQGQQAQTPGPFIRGIQQRQMLFEERAAEHERQRLQSLQQLAQLQTQMQFRDAQAERQALQQEFQRFIQTQRLENEQQRLAFEAQRVEFAGRNAQTAEEKLALQERLGGLNAQIRQLGLDLQQQRLDLQREKQFGLPRATGPARDERRDLTQLIGAVREAQALVDKSVGGPVAGRFAFADPSIATLRTLFADINTLIGPNRLGATIPAGEREIIAGLLADEKSTRTNQKAALNYIERVFGLRLKGIEEEFDFGPGSGIESTVSPRRIQIEVDPDGKLRRVP